MAHYDQNIDSLNSTGLPIYEKAGTQGLQVTFTSESGYVEPYDLDDFKDYARIDFDTDDNLLAIFLKAARVDVERYLQKSLGIRTISLTALKLPKNYVLPYGPVQSVSTTGYTNVGDILKEGGIDVVIEYISNASLVNDSITKSIYAQALHYYEYRNKFSQLQGTIVDEVKMCLYSFKKIQFP
jgi:hypothetical protein